MFDDASDGTKEVALNYIEKHPGKVRLIQKEERMGLGGARKEAMNYIDGGYVYSLDADDAMVPGALKLLVDALERENADMVNASFYEVKQGSTKPYFFKKRAIWNSHQALAALFNDASFRSFLWAKLFRAELLRARPMALLQGSKAMFEDLSLVTSLLLGAKKIVQIDGPVVYYREDIATSSSTEKRKDRAIRHLAAFALCRQIIERSGDKQALRIFFAHRLRTYFSIDYDLKKDRQAGASKEYVALVKRAFKQLYQKGALVYEDAPYGPYLEGAFLD